MVGVECGVDSIIVMRGLACGHTSFTGLPTKIVNDRQMHYKRTAKTQQDCCLHCKFDIGYAKEISSHTAAFVSNSNTSIRWVKRIRICTKRSQVNENLHSIDSRCHRPMAQKICMPCSTASEKMWSWNNVLNALPTGQDRTGQDRTGQDKRKTIAYLF